MKLNEEICGRKVRIMLKNLEEGISLGRKYGGWIAFTDHSAEWFSLGWKRSEIICAKTGDFRLEPWGAIATELRRNA